MRVLFTTTGHSGHLLPLVPVARACAAAGDEVAVAIHRPRAGHATSRGLEAIPLDVSPDEAWAPLMAALPGLAQGDGDARIVDEGFAAIGAGGALPAMLEAVRAWAPDVVVHESYEFAGPVAAERLGVPVARVALGLASTEDWVDRLAARAVRELRRAAGLGDAPAPPRPPLLSMVPETLDDGPAERFRAPGAAPPDRPDPHAGDPLVYVTLGSVAGSLPAFYPGLYRQVLDALAPMPVRVLLTLGTDADPAKLGTVPANARAEAWVDQEEVLATAAAVVSHAGFGTTLGALAHGVPPVLVPLFAGDQWRTAARVAERGAGVLLADGERRVMEPPGEDLLARLAAAVERALTDPALRTAAGALAREIAALPGPEAAAAALRRR